MLKTLLAPTDAAALTGEFAEYLAYTGREGLAPGSQGLAARIPGVDARLLEHDGHVTLLTNRIGEVHAWLADRF